jgi:AcrR family transcriptional regulator
MAMQGAVRRNTRAETVGERTRLDILEATETLLALNGPSATSIRSIAARADVNVAAINYHFHSKDGLIDELLRRRAAPLNQQRLSELDTATQAAAPGGLALTDILRALVAPMLQFAALEPLPARALVAAQFLSRAAHRPGGFSAADPLHAQVEKRFLEALAAVLPELDAPTLLARYRLVEGALNLAMCGADDSADTPQAEPSEQKADRLAVTEAQIANFIAFTAAGLRSKAA